MRISPLLCTFAPDCLCASLPSVTTQSVQTRIDNIQCLKSLSKGLGVLKKNLDSFITCRRDGILPATYHRGFTMLSREIVVRIVKEMHAQYEDEFNGALAIIRDLSLVSRSLRNTVLQTPELWSYLDLDACELELLDLFLRRSGDQPLSVRFTYSAWTSPKILYTLPSHDRWCYLFARSPLGSPRALTNSLV